MVWSPKWWSSPAWKVLAELVVGDTWDEHNLCKLIAAFVELSPPDQFILEQRFGIGVERQTLKTLASFLPRRQTPQVGITPEMVHTRALRATRRLRSKWYTTGAARWRFG